MFIDTYLISCSFSCSKLNSRVPFEVLHGINICKISQAPTIMGNGIPHYSTFFPTHWLDWQKFSFFIKVHFLIVSEDILVLDGRGREGPQKLWHVFPCISNLYQLITLKEWLLKKNIKMAIQYQYRLSFLSNCPVGHLPFSCEDLRILQLLNKVSFTPMWWEAGI